MSKGLFQNLLLIFVIVTVAGCANRGTPSGGEKDTEPPKILKTVPENFSTNFNTDEIRIYFDEYIKIKNIQKQLIISPPMNTQPDITPLGGAGKYIKIKLHDTLQPNTTYAFNFGESIVDNNEENPYPYYRYVFSTGDYIDSLSVSGQVVDAKERKTDKFVSVMLYEMDSTYTDSTVYKKKPKYITNTLDSLTTFKIDNIKAGKYKLIALKEENSNYTFQQKTDKIGFYEGVVNAPTDSLFTLKLFKEEPDFKALRPKQGAGQRIIFGYEGDYKDVKIDLLADKPEDFETRITKNPKTDTLYYWYRPKLELDSAQFVVRNRTYIDTLDYRFRDLEKDSLEFKPLQSGTIHFNQDFQVQANIPFTKIDEKQITILDQDSSNVSFSTALDSLENIYTFKFDKKEADRYNIQMLPNTFEDFFGNPNDTLNFSLRTNKKSDYGNIRVRLINAKFPLILQLVDNTGKVMYEKYTTESSIVDFNDLSPKQYYLRAIFDANGNKKYDPGSFLMKRQPERVSYAQDIDPVRANFDFIINFTLKD
ncbi:MAG TPA: Ig-like domain-containing protein [Flavobacteriaceae bacterium]|nr:Ig-like domain-containing protein [Flavobacteriaceae bacterium]